MPRRTPLIVAALLAAVAAVAGVIAVTREHEPVAAAEADGSALFPDGFWQRPLPADAPVDPGSAAFVRRLLTSRPLVSVNGWTVAAYEADATTPTYRITATADHLDSGWVLPRVPVPAAAAPDPQADGHLVVIDRATRCVYEMWQARRTGDAWSASWINATPADGDGVYPDGLSARGSGLSAAAGLIWPQELAAGHIDHALAFAYPHTRAGDPVPPATHSDGRNGDGRTALPQGARLRLDPALDLDKLGLPPEQHTIAVALQRYGMVLADTAGGFTLYAAAPRSFLAFPYPAGWAAGVWADISGIPFDRLQVLALPASRGPAAPPVRNRCTADAVTG